jgi:outer membrane receptor for ferrienterochelin and colicins
MNLTLSTSRKSLRAIPILSFALASLLSIILNAPLTAQSVDYGALEQLFKEPVTTSVDGSPQRVSDVPATMEIITAEDIRRSGAKDIPGILRHVGGLDTLEWGNDDVDVGIRGYDQAFSPRLLVLVDGRQVYTDDFSYTPWITVPVELSMIRQIEIIKGPNSALFGFNAAGGVINIITKSPLYDEVNTASATGGTQALGAVSLVATRHFGTRGAVRLSAGGDLDSDFSTPIPATENDLPRTEDYRAAFNLNGVLRLSSKMQLGLDATQSVAEDNEMGPAYSIGVGRYTTSSVKMNLSAESRTGLLHVSGYTNWLKETSTPGADGNAYHFDNRVTVAQIDDTFRVGTQHILRAAMEYRRDLEATTPTTGATLVDNDIAVSGMWSWKLTPAIALTNAIRIDHLVLGRDGYLPPDYPFTDADWNRSHTVLSFNIALVVKPSDTDSLRLMISRGTQLPSLSTSGAFLVDTRYVKMSGSPFINPMTVTNYEIGWDHALAGPHLLVRVSAFHQDNRDLPAVAGESIPTASGAYLVGSNIGSSTANGLELGVMGTLRSHLRWSVAYRPEKITDHLLPFAQNGAAYTEYEQTTPRHLLKANLGWANDRWEIDGFLQYQSTNHGLQPILDDQGTMLTPISAFAAIDGRVAYNLNQRITWAVSGQNLAHASQIQTSGPAVERRVLGTMTFNF